MKQQQKAQKAKKGLVATTIVSTVLTVAMVASIGAFVGLNFNTVKAIANGETMLNQSDAEALIDTAKSEGYNSGFETGLREAKYIENRINVGDFVDGFYYNVSAVPNFEQLDWDRAHVVVNKDNAPDEYILGDKFAELRILYLITNFNPPTTNESFFDQSYYKAEDHGVNGWPKLQLQIMRYMLLGGTYGYMFMQNGSHGIYVSSTMAKVLNNPHIPAGWWEEGNVKDSLDYSEGETVVYVNDQQRIWGNWVSINTIKQVPNPVYPYSK